MAAKLAGGSWFVVRCQLSVACVGVSDPVNMKNLAALLVVGSLAPLAALLVVSHLRKKTPPKKRPARPLAATKDERMLVGWRRGTGEVSAKEARRQASAITRKLRLLRGHGLIRKVPKTHRYLLTDRGRSAIAALLAARQANIEKLGQLAA